MSTLKRSIAGARPPALGTLLAAGAVFLAAYAALLPFPETHRWLGGVAYQLTPLGCLALLPPALRRTKGAERAAWLCMALMLVTWESAELVYSYYSLVLNASAPFPSVADGLYYVGYIGLGAALAVMTYPSGGNRTTRVWCDSLAVTVIAAVLAWQFVGSRTVAGADGHLQAAAALGYPALDLTLFAVVVLGYFSANRPCSVSSLWLLAASGSLLITDSAYDLLMKDTVDSASYLDLGWQVGYLCIAAAAVTAGNASAGSRQVRFGGGGLSLWLPYVAAAPLVVLAATEEISGTPAQVLVLGAFASLMLLVARQWTVLQENASLSRRAELHAAELAAAVQQLERERGAAAFLASHDPLTGLLNFRGWWEAARSGPVTVVVMFDIDFFKAINDNHGHPAGDEVLATVAERLSGALAGLGDLGRVGGEEFAFAGRGDSQAVLRATAIALEAVHSQPLTLRSGGALAVTLSAGAAEACDFPSNPAVEELYRTADRALYDAKHAGRDRLVDAGDNREAA